MGTVANATRPLTDNQHRLTGAQQRLVRDNMGLVGVHLKRFVRGLSRPRRDREWDDLFQEGVIGLIHAARTYRADRGQAFAKHALPRIHRCVSDALQQRFALVRVPRGQGIGRPEPGGDDADDADEPTRRDTADPRDPAHPRVVELTEDVEHDLATRARRRDRAPHPPSGETVGDRLRAKYERAVAGAGAELMQAYKMRGDRDRLVAAVIRERLLIPEWSARTTLRAIARALGCSYARVSLCERRLIDGVRGLLASDPEFSELRRRCRASHSGVDLPVDDGLESALADASCARFVARFARGDWRERTRLLRALLEAARVDVFAFARQCFDRLTPEDRERILREPYAHAADAHRDDARVTMRR